MDRLSITKQKELLVKQQKALNMDSAFNFYFVKNNKIVDEPEV